MELQPRVRPEPIGLLFRANLGLAGKALSGFWGFGCLERFKSLMAGSPVDEIAAQEDPSPRGFGASPVLATAAELARYKYWDRRTSGGKEPKEHCFT
jgi:hypothetical protein